MVSIRNNVRICLLKYTVLLSNHSFLLINVLFFLLKYTILFIKILFLIGKHLSIKIYSVL